MGYLLRDFSCHVAIQDSLDHTTEVLFQRDHGYARWIKLDY